MSVRTRVHAFSDHVNTLKLGLWFLRLFRREGQVVRNRIS